ncbi:MAG TPA: GNAT family N-acetyltransferase [Micromonosporaceae bacterium]|jgi:ribosomal protein S18 acetylase RimI-like enzyme
MGVRVRRAEVADADAVAVVHVRGWQGGYAGIMPADTLAALDVDERAERWRERFAASTPSPYDTYVAENGAGAVIGFATVGPYRNQQRPDDIDARFGELLAIYVHPDHWGTGVGRALMETALAELATRGWTEIRLWVLEDNARARRFYERFGLLPDGERAAFAVDRPGGRSPAEVVEVRYALPLPARTG